MYTGIVVVVPNPHQHCSSLLIVQSNSFIKRKLFILLPEIGLKSMKKSSSRFSLGGGPSSSLSMSKKKIRLKLLHSEVTIMIIIVQVI